MSQLFGLTCYVEFLLFIYFILFVSICLDSFVFVLLSRFIYLFLDTCPSFNCSTVGVRNAAFNNNNNNNGTTVLKVIIDFDCGLPGNLDKHNYSLFFLFFFL